MSSAVVLYRKETGSRGCSLASCHTALEEQLLQTFWFPTSGGPLRFKGIAAKVQSAQTSVIKWPCLAEGQGLQVLFLPLTQHELGAQPRAVIGQTNIHPIIKCTQVPQLWQLLTTRSLTRHTGPSPPSQVGHFGN